ncbi:restriction endonuclease subunit S [Streptomyces griseorubiginosus]|uniref:restriction endonuclease subunit S n=1 Tax=Streptomyces griseorubiginosus TaxID=67304 RepID=UPI00099ED172|nr:restriction endonuclease subunit S [Streptomyces griseorubiginosus]
MNTSVFDTRTLRLPDTYELVRLGYVARLQNGLTVDAKRDVTGDVVTRPYLRVANVQAGSLSLESVTEITVPRSVARRSTLRPGDVLMTEGGDLDKLGRGTVWQGELEGCLHQNHVFAIRPLPQRLNGRFLAYLTQSHYGRHYFESTGTRTTNLASTNSNKIQSFPLPLPPLGEQRRITDFLDAETSRLDDMAKTQVLLIERLKERAGVVIELTLSNASSRSVRLKRMLTAPMSYGANESTEHDRRDWPRYIRTTDIANDGTLRDETFASLPLDAARNYMLSDGDLLFVRSGATVGKSFVYESQYGPAAHAGYLIRARVNRNLTLPRLIWYFCQTAAYWQQVNEGAIQATIQNVNAEKYGNLLVPLVDRERQDSTLAILDSQLAKSRNLQHRAEQLLELLAERRQALITAAVTGQFDVSTASGRNVTDGVTA